MNRIVEVDAVGYTMTVEAGVILKTIQETAAAARPAVSAEPRRRGQLHHRRQSLDQCRRRAGAALRQRPPARAGAGGRDAAGRDLERPARAQEGQYRLRPARPLSRRRGHARHHHQGDPEALAQAQGRRDLVDCRALARGRRGAAERRACRQRGQRHLLRADGPPGRRPGAEAHPGARPIRWPNGTTGTCCWNGRRPGRAAPAPTRPGFCEKMEAYLGEAMEQGLVLDAALAQNEAQARAFWALARKPLGVPEARRPVDQARHLGVGEQDPRLHDGRPCRDEEGAARNAGRCRSAMSATATSTSTARRRPAGTRPRFMAHAEAISGAVYDLGRGPWRLDLGRARHRPDEGRRARPLPQQDRARHDARRSSARSIRRT